MASKVSTAAKLDLGQAFRALSHRNYRLFFIGQGVSLLGAWMQRMALGWLVYRLTESPFMLGAVGFCSQILVPIIAPFAGNIADQGGHRRLLIMTQSLAMVQALVLSVLTLSGLVQVWHIVTLSLTLGLVNGFDMPLRQAFVVEMLEDRRDLPNAIAMNSLVFNMTRLVGPVLAGVLVALWGEGYAFLINAMTFLTVICALWMMKFTRKELPHRRRRPVGRRLMEGFKYSASSVTIRNLLLLLALVSLMGIPYGTLLPAFVATNLGRGPEMLGLVQGAAGLGAVCGAILLACRSSVLGLGRTIAMASLLFGGALTILAMSGSIALILALMTVVGFGNMTITASINTILQTVVEDRRRGRVMSLYTMAVIGMSTLGALLMGWIASGIGARGALAIGGASCLVFAGLFALQLPKIARHVRNVYARRGVIPPVEADSAQLQVKF
jgi:MFS family permease